jgi:glycosyltransferase involved in cell wall biosynthesis
MTPPRLSIVLPAYREADSLAEALQAIRAAADPIGPAEYIVVDDGSTDATWSVVRHLAESLPDLRGIRLSRNFGKEGAIAAGLAASRGAAVIVMDADLQHPPALIPEMVRLWEGGAEVVNTVKRTRGDEGPVRKWLARRYFGLFAALAGADIGNAADFKLLDRRVVDCLNALPERERFFRGLVGWVGFRQESLPFDVAPRRKGQSKWSMLKLTTLALNSIFAFSTLPMQLMTALGIAFAALATVLGLRTLWLWAAGNAVPGFTTVILLLIFIGAVLMIGLGIIGAYIAKIYEEVKGRPRFIVQESAPPADGPAQDSGRDRTARSSEAASTGSARTPANER